MVTLPTPRVSASGFGPELSICLPGRRCNLHVLVSMIGSALGFPCSPGYCDDDTMEPSIFRGDELLVLEDPQPVSGRWTLLEHKTGVRAWAHCRTAPRAKNDRITFEFWMSRPSVQLDLEQWKVIGYAVMRLPVANPGTFEFSLWGLGG